MRRREFITLLGGGAAWPLVASAQQPGKIYRIGYLSPTTGLEARDKAFLQGLQELGYIEGKNIVIDYRFAHGKFGAAPSLRPSLFASTLT